MTDLFIIGDFTLHSGMKTNWKIECNSLTLSDWKSLAKIAVGNLPAFGEVIGVPRGGLVWAEALKPYATEGPRLIVDDVLTTGASMLELKKDKTDLGLVLFARVKCPKWITPVFVTAFS